MQASGARDRISEKAGESGKAGQVRYRRRFSVNGRKRDRKRDRSDIGKLGSFSRLEWLYRQIVVRGQKAGQARYWQAGEL